MPNEYIEWFVNREKQRQGFLKMIDGATKKQIMMVKAPAEMGKTWLIQRLFHDCRGRAIPVALLDFSQRQPWDYLTFVRQARDQLGVAYFNHLTQVINEITTVRVESVAVQVSIKDSELVNSNIKVDDIKLATDNFAAVHAESDLVRRNLEIRITDAFLACLQSMAQGGRVVFLIDTLDLAPEPAVVWLVGNLFRRIRDGALPGVLLIGAGRAVPDLDPSWREWVAATPLEPFNNDHIEEFIAKRGLQDRPDISSETLMLLSRGHPGLLGKMADNALLDELAEEKESWM
jgi:hypothetical protein